MSPKKHLCYVWCCYGNSTRRKCPSSLPLQVAEFWGTPSESVWCHPRNICAKFGDCTQKCTIKLLSDPTNITFDTQLKTALAGKVAQVLLALDHRAYLKTPPPQKNANCFKCSVKKCYMYFASSSDWFMAFIVSVLVARVLLWFCFYCAQLRTTHFNCSSSN